MKAAKAVVGLLVAASLVVGPNVREARAQSSPSDAFGNLTNLITAGSYLAGLGFSIGAIMKFRQHKDNPTQIPIGTPIAVVAVAAALIMLPNVFSCPVFVGRGTLLGEDSCVWSKATGNLGTEDNTDTQGLDWRVGGQFEVGPGWFLGGALGTGASFSQTPGGPAETGRSYDAALALKRVDGPLFLAGAVGIVSSSDQSTWSSPAVSSSVSSFNAGLLLRGAYEVMLDPVYLRPRLDVGVGLLSQSGEQLSGSSVGVTVDPVSKVGTQITPMLEIGGRHDIGKVILRPYVAGGAEFVPDSTLHLSGTVAGTPIAGDLSGPNVLGIVEAGLQVYEAKSWESKLEYRLVTADQYLDQSLGLRLARHF